jgi:hypothetical protein
MLVHYIGSDSDMRGDRHIKLKRSCQYTKFSVRKLRLDDIGADRLTYADPVSKT